MTADKRQVFLQKVWQPYPEAPRQVLKFGRVHQLRCGTQNLSSHKPVENTDLVGADILIDGDLVGLLPAGKFILLAPNLSQKTLDQLTRDEAWTTQRHWLEFLQYIESFFIQKKFMRGRSPVLTVCPGTEPSLDVFSTTFKNGRHEKKLFLSTSPELSLKKMLSLGAEKIYEIAPVFRNGEQTTRHLFQFHMLEWYRAYSQLPAIKHDVIELFELAAQFLKVEQPKEALTFTVAELFQKYLEFKFTPETSIEDLKRLAEKNTIDVRAAQVIDDYFYLIFMEKIEFQWAKDRLVFVEKYPPYQAALARIGSDGWAERFEVYYNGLEIGNAFHELNNPILQRARAIDDLEKKRAFGKEQIELDEDFFAAMDFGIPPASGIAIGLERLFMSLLGMNEIDKLERHF